MSALEDVNFLGVSGNVQFTKEGKFIHHFAMTIYTVARYVCFEINR